MMKRLTLILVFLTAAGLFWPKTALAENQGGGGTVVLPAGQVVNNDYFAAGGMVTLSGVVNGDAFLAGGTVSVDGTVNGDLLVMAGTVNISGKVSNNIRAIGGQVNITGETGRNASAIGGTISLSPSAKVAGNVSLVANQVTLAGSIGGNANIADSQLTLASQAKIGGNLTYLSQSSARIQSGATVSGTTTHNFPPATPVPATEALAAIGLLTLFTDFISALIIGMILIIFAPVYTQRVNNVISRAPWETLGIGLLIFIVVPIIIFFLTVFIITLPLALVLLGFYLINLYLTKIFVFLLIGQLILGKRAGGWALTLGLVIFELISLVPVLGGIVMFLTVIFGLGAIFLGSRDLYLEERGKKLV